MPGWGMISIEMGEKPSLEMECPRPVVLCAIPLGPRHDKQLCIRASLVGVVIHRASSLTAVPSLSRFCHSHTIQGFREGSRVQG